MKKIAVLSLLLGMIAGCSAQGSVRVQEPSNSASYSTQADNHYYIV